MKIIIATPLYPPDIGGPSKYAEGLKEAFSRTHAVTVIAYGECERRLPTGLRHILYAIRLALSLREADFILALDTLSVGIPAVLVGKIFGIPALIRIGGDPLWESYVQRTADLVKLSAFYGTDRPLSLKERLLFEGTRFLCRNAHTLLFTTSWQRNLWKEPYVLSSARTAVIENEYPQKRKPAVPGGKIFVAAGRDIALKNIPLLRSIFAEIQNTHKDISLDTEVLPQNKHLKRIEQSYAVVISSVSEVNPNTVIEAVSLDKPFIAPRDSGIYDRLKDVGIFVDTTNESELKTAIERLLDPEEYARRVEVLKSFSYVHTWSDIADEILMFTTR